MMYLMVILALVSFFLVASFYQGNLVSRQGTPRSSAMAPNETGEKLPGSGPSGPRPFQSPYHETGR
jgi:hypothetical protein